VGRGTEPSRSAAEEVGAACPEAPADPGDLLA
jgi:hypothetical protein